MRPLTPTRVAAKHLSTAAVNLWSEIKSWTVLLGIALASLIWYLKPLLLFLMVASLPALPPVAFPTSFHNSMISAIHVCTLKRDAPCSASHYCTTNVCPYLPNPTYP